MELCLYFTHVPSWRKYGQPNIFCQFNAALCFALRCDFRELSSIPLQPTVPPSGHYMYRTVATICTAQWPLYVPHSGHYMYRPVATICAAQWSLYVPPIGHYMYRPVATVCTAQWSLYVPPVVTVCTTSLTFNNSTFCPHSVFMCFVWI